MIKVYGIKTCNSVRKALKFFKDHEIEVDFFDFKKETPSSQTVDSWVEKTDLNVLFNSRGTKYRTLKLKELNLDDAGKIKWLKDEPMLFKRPIIEYDGKVMLAFDEEVYKETFL